MKTHLLSLLAGTALIASVGVASASEMVLSENQMDQVTAGGHTGRTHTGRTGAAGYGATVYGTTFQHPAWTFNGYSASGNYGYVVFTGLAQ